MIERLAKRTGNTSQARGSKEYYWLEKTVSRHDRFLFDVDVYNGAEIFYLVQEHTVNILSF